MVQRLLHYCPENTGESAELVQKPLNPWDKPRGERPLTDDERTLVLTAEELNVLLQKDTQWAGRFYVSLEGDHIQARISLPLSELNWEPLKGRYLNGEARVVVVLVDGEVRIYLRDIRVKGQPLPEALREGIEKQDFAAGPPDQPRPRPPRKLEKLEVKDGRITIVLRPEPNRPSPVGVP